MPNDKFDTSEAMLKELSDIKKLLVLQLLSNGSSQKHIASALGISAATMSRMAPKGVTFAKGASGDR